MIELRLDDSEARILADFLKKHMLILLKRASEDDGRYLLSEKGAFLTEMIEVLESELKIREAE